MRLCWISHSHNQLGFTVFLATGRVSFFPVLNRVLGKTSKHHQSIATVHYVPSVEDRYCTSACAGCLHEMYTSPTVFTQIHNSWLSPAPLGIRGSTHSMGSMALGLVGKTGSAPHLAAKWIAGMPGEGQVAFGRLVLFGDS